jgi:hypothetical protein
MRYKVIDNEGFGFAERIYTKKELIDYFFI